MTKRGVKYDCWFGLIIEKEGLAFTGMETAGGHVLSRNQVFLLDGLTWRCLFGI